MQIPNKVIPVLFISKGVIVPILQIHAHTLCWLNMFLCLKCNNPIRNGIIASGLRLLESPKYVREYVSYTVWLPAKFDIAAAWCLLLLCNIFSSPLEAAIFFPPIFLLFSVAVQWSAEVGCVLFKISNRSAFFLFMAGFYQCWFSAPLKACWGPGWWSVLDQEFKNMEKYLPTMIY